MKIQKVINGNIIQYTVTNEDETTIKAYQDSTEITIIDNVFEVSLGNPYIILIEEYLNGILKDKYIEYINSCNEKEAECEIYQYKYPLMNFEGPEIYKIGNNDAKDYNQGFLEGLIVGGITSRGI